MVVGISVMLFLPDSPVHASFLTREERIAAIERVRDDQGGTENRRFKREQAIEALKDVRTWLVVLSTLVSKCLQLAEIMKIKFLICFHNSEYTKRRIRELYVYFY